MYPILVCLVCLPFVCDSVDLFVSPLIYVRINMLTKQPGSWITLAIPAWLQVSGILSCGGTGQNICVYCPATEQPGVQARDYPGFVSLLLTLEKEGAVWDCWLPVPKLP